MKTSIFKKCALGAAVLLPMAGIGGLGLMSGVAGASGWASITYTGTSPGSTVVVDAGGFTIDVNFAALYPDATCSGTASGSTSSTGTYSYSTTNNGVTACTVIPGSSISVTSDSNGVETLTLAGSNGASHSTSTAYSVLSGTAPGSIAVGGCAIYGITNTGTASVPAPVNFDDNASLTENDLQADPTTQTINTAAAANAPSGTCSSTAETFLNGAISADGVTVGGYLTISSFTA